MKSLSLVAGDEGDKDKKKKNTIKGTKKGKKAAKIQKAKGINYWRT